MSAIGAFRHAAVHGRLRHGGGDAQDQARIERLGNQVFGAEATGSLRRIRRPLHRLFGLGQFGDGVYRRLLHGFVDGGGAHVQRAAEDEGEAQDVVDLVRIVGAAGGHDGVGAHRLDQFRHDLGRRDWPAPRSAACWPSASPFGLQHAAGRQTQEDIGPDNDLAKRAGGGRPA